VITRNDIIDALTKCTGYDSAHTPVPNEITVDAWREHFDLFPNVTREDLLRSVTEHFRAKHTDQLTPVDLSDIARKYSRDRIEKSETDSIERQRLEAICDAKAAPEVAAIEAAAADRKLAVDSYARIFGITPAEAAVRMNPSRGTANAMDTTAVEVAHVRHSRPPAPVECPDCGLTEVPCPCDLTVS
jgi:hypothetical protein